MNYAQFFFYIFQVFTAFPTPVHWRMLITKTDKRDPDNYEVYRDEEELLFYDFVDRMAQQTGADSRRKQGALLVKKFMYDRLYCGQDVRNSNFYGSEYYFIDVLVWYTHKFTNMEIAKVYDDDRHKTRDFTDELDTRWSDKNKDKDDWDIDEEEYATYFAQDYDPNNEYENYSYYDDDSDYDPDNYFYSNT